MPLEEVEKGTAFVYFLQVKGMQLLVLGSCMCYIFL